MNILKKIFLFSFIFTFSSSLYAATLSQIRLAKHKNDSLRFVIQSSKEEPYSISILKKPLRILIDFEDSSFDKNIKNNFSKFSKLLKDIRVGKINKTNARVVLELQENYTPDKAFYLKPQSGFDWRFVLDIKPASKNQIDLFKPFGTMKKLKISPKTDSSKARLTQNSPYKKPVIVLDPGHGGKDPGAISYSGYYEKNLTLLMAKEVYALLMESGKYRIYLTRTKDVALPLRSRIKKAHKVKADLFISIHADSAHNRKARGLSVYTISERASDREAQLLARRENKADIILGIDLSHESKEVSNILIDLAKRETINRSVTFADLVVDEMKKQINLVPNAHRFAGFVVLKSPNIPSVLVEIGYLSNKYEERLLKKKYYRRKIASSLVKGIDIYFDSQRKH
ncbi:MAG: N-acetylmuramoyl-L-alanine amidase [Alphaproteobacteria bacterium]|nr:N-acetylmuramoyl-L-alanine amidase [Alphaproteobacteria bacterium]